MPTIGCVQAFQQKALEMSAATPAPEEALPRIRKTATRLADGRELLYFDDRNFAADRRNLIDRRQLPPQAASSIRRFDRLLGEWVTIAQHRQTRTYLPPDTECPLCPSTPSRPTEIPAEDYDVVVFENRFPSFASTASPGETTAPDETHPFFASDVGHGRCEVVCFTADHAASFSSLSLQRVRTVVEVWVDRTRELSRLEGVEQVFCFENRGREIGVTLSHPHGQIYAYPFVTPRTERMLENARRYHREVGGNLFADNLAAELASGRRIIATNEHWVAFVPYAARWPLEVHLYPRRRVPDLPELSEAERGALAHLYRDVLRRMEALYSDELPYIAAWHQAPVRRDRDLAYLHAEIFSIRRAPGKLKYLAGSESAMGAFVSDVLPDEVAARLRDVNGSTP